VLKGFYLELRAKAMATEGAPITTRQLESLVRLAEARARSLSHPLLLAVSPLLLQIYLTSWRMLLPGVLSAWQFTQEGMFRVELREVATEEDALEVVDLMRHTLLDEFLDGSGMLDFRRAGGKSKQV
jgi:DNA helicase MCM8